MVTIASGVAGGWSALGKMFFVSFFIIIIIIYLKDRQHVFPSLLWGKQHLLSYGGIGAINVAPPPPSSNVWQNGATPNTLAFGFNIVVCVL